MIEPAVLTSERAWLQCSCPPKIRRLRYSWTVRASCGGRGPLPVACGSSLGHGAHTHLTGQLQRLQRQYESYICAVLTPVCCLSRHWSLARDDVLGCVGLVAVAASLARLCISACKSQHAACAHSASLPRARLVLTPLLVESLPPAVWPEHLCGLTCRSADCAGVGAGVVAPVLQVQIEQIEHACAGGLDAWGEDCW